MIDLHECYRTLRSMLNNLYNKLGGTQFVGGLGDRGEGGGEWGRHVEKFSQ